MAEVGLCKLCQKQKSLKISHAVGNSVFKRIYKQNSGTAITLTSGDEDIHYSNDSWAEYQLCGKCESLLNTNYERYSLGVLRGVNIEIRKTTIGVSFENINQSKLILYFLSILWRAANSTHPAYKNVVITDSDNELLRNSILNNLKISSGNFSVKVNRVVDLTRSEKKFTPQSIKEFIVSPFCRIYEDTKVNNVSVCLMFEGFFIEIFMPALKLKERNRVGVLNKNKKIFITPYLNLFEIDEVVDLMAKNLGKYIDGKSKIKANKAIKRN